MPALANVRIGPCSIVYGGVNIGHTQGGVTFHYERNEVDLTVDQYGSTPVDIAIAGVNVTVECNLAEPTLDNLNAVIPEGAHAQNGSNKRLGFGGNSGHQLRQYSAQLVLHPLNKAASDLSEDVTLYKAVATGNIDLAYTVDGQRVVPVLFRALVDETYGDGRALGHFGPADIS